MTDQTTVSGSDARRQDEQPQDHLAADGNEAATVRDEFKREIDFSPAFDRRSADPRKDYGIHGVECIFTLSKNGKGITFTIYTNWMLPHVQEETDARPISSRFPFLSHKPMPAGVDWHDTKPHYEGQSICRDECAVTGGICYSDGSGLMADGIFTILLEQGSEGVWKRLEQLYVEWLELSDDGATS
jgi:hypothetical protein